MTAQPCAGFRLQPHYWHAVWCRIALKQVPGCEQQGKPHCSPAVVSRLAGHTSTHRPLPDLLPFPPPTPTDGWHIMGLYGVKSVMISNSRGFCIELATAMVVIVAARFGWVLGAAA